MNVFVDAATLHGMTGAVVLEVRRDAAVPDQHLPGALLTTLDDFSGPPSAAGKRPLPDVAALAERVQRWGIDPASAVVAYDHDGGFESARAWWVLRWAGVKNVSILNGGLPAWRAAGLPLGAPGDEPGGGEAVLRPGGLPQLDADDAAAYAEEGRLVDARGDTAYANGHIPDARLVASRDTRGADGLLLDDDALRALYGLDAAHVDDADPAPGLYCGGGVAAAHGVAVLAHLGVTAPLYVGSFSAWSAAGRPVAAEQGTS